MKKNLIVLFVLVSLSLTACGGNSSSAAAIVAQPTAGPTQEGYTRPADLCNIEGYPIKGVCVKIQTFSGNGQTTVNFWSLDPIKLPKVWVAIEGETKEIESAGSAVFATEIGGSHNFELLNGNCTPHGGFSAPENQDTSWTYVYDCVVP